MENGGGPERCSGVQDGGSLAGNDSSEVSSTMSGLDHSCAVWRTFSSRLFMAFPPLRSPPRNGPGAAALFFFLVFFLLLVRWLLARRRGLGRRSGMRGRRRGRFID